VSAVLLDTNVVSALRVPQRQDAAFQLWLAGHDLGTSYVSVFTWMELRAGMLKKRRADPVQGRVLETWLDAIRVPFQTRTIPFDDATAALCAPMWLLRPRGSIDTLIAATALAWRLTLVTRNVSDFTDIPGLSVVNPWADEPAAE